MDTIAVAASVFENIWDRVSSSDEYCEACFCADVIIPQFPRRDNKR